MIKTFFSIATGLILFGSVHAQDTAAIVQSARIIQASAADKKDAETKTQRMIGNYSYADSLYSGFCFIGPRLWDQLKDLEEFKALHLANLALSVPVYNKKGKETDDKDPRYGKMIQSPGSFHTFSEYIYSAYNIKGAKIVPMNDRDKFIYWSYYKNIEEPIVVIQSDKGRILLKFTKGHLLFAELTGK